MIKFTDIEGNEHEVKKKDMWFNVAPYGRGIFHVYLLERQKKGFEISYLEFNRLLKLLEK
jgi:hypothetical protein